MPWNLQPGPQTAGYTAAPPLLPFQPNFKRVGEQIRIDVQRDPIGFTREHSSTLYPHASFRSQKASYTLTGEEIAQFLHFFQTVSGPGAPFWASGWLHVARLTQDVAADSAVLNVVDTLAVNIGDYLSIYTGTIIARKVIGKNANTITLDAAPGVLLRAVNTCVFPLCLVRLTRPTITMAWKRPGAARSELEWEELPPEVLLPGDEGLGLTTGKLPLRVILFQFTRDLGNGTVLDYYFTNFEHDLNWNGQIWTHGIIDTCSDIPQSLNLEDDQVEVTSFIAAGNPMVDDVALLSEAPLSVTIRFAAFDGAHVANVETVFTGDATAPQRSGNKLTVQCKVGPALLESHLPIYVRGKICNNLRGSNADGTHLISVGCTGPDNIMLKANWKFTGEVIGPLPAGFPFTLNLNTLVGVGANAAAALAAAGQIFTNYFAGGWVEWGAGANVQRRGITGSTALAVGAIALNLHRSFTGVPNLGEVITFYPGCDGTAETCKAFNAVTNTKGKFNNHVNFGADEFSPIGNPSASGQPILATQGSKK